eukprot:CAMPEP_0170548528 /NCGR_PEP_ID=MMETSP0211-20121228/6830_1 /TAXON_ID=311385 /ORGANISM="Pseudokeronopsis sp., Strain OXSARD2" /LENGTH=140 /DNA_ID=CAMNT_0010854121 /DNA_START=239 /DNA_END=661 /DNA_ORIENTATION=-
MAPKLLIHKVPHLISCLLNDVTYPGEGDFWPTDVDSLEHDFPGSLAQLSDVFVHISYHHHSRGVSKAPFVEASDIDIEVVSILQDIVGGHPMRDHLIHRGTHTLGEVHKVDATGVSILTQDKLMDDSVYIIQTHSLLGVL